jgi:hypothetical protein
MRAHAAFEFRKHRSASKSWVDGDYHAGLRCLSAGKEVFGGERRCPPGVCGGIPGYYEFLDNIASKQNNKRKAALDWYGGPYDPDEIGEQQVITALSRVANTRRPSR